MIVSLESGISLYKLSNILREHSILFTDFYIDFYRAFKHETLSIISREYLSAQIDETNAKKLKRKFSLLQDNNDVFTPKEVQMFSAVMVELHLIAVEYYNHLYNARQKFYCKQEFSRTFMPKPFNVSMLNQMAIYFRIYMKRIRDQINEKMYKLDSAFAKVNSLRATLHSIDTSIEEAMRKLANLEKLKLAWEEKIEQQKDVYRIAVDECRKEDKLIEEMSTALEKLRSDVNSDSQNVNSTLSPQYEMALKGN